MIDEDDFLYELFLEIEKHDIMRSHARLLLSAKKQYQQLKQDRERLVYQDRWLQKGVYFTTQEYLDHLKLIEDGMIKSFNRGKNEKKEI